MALQLSQYHLLTVPSFPNGLRCSLYHMLNSREILNGSLFRNSFLRFSTTLLSGVPLPHMPTQDVNFFLLKIPNSSSSELPVGGKSNGLCSLGAGAAGLVWPSALIGSQGPGLLRVSSEGTHRARKHQHRCLNMNHLARLQSWPESGLIVRIVTENVVSPGV